MRLPVVAGSNLLRKKITLPADLQGELNLLLIPFYQWQQAEVDTWLALAEQLASETPGLFYYELPTIQSRNVLSQVFINEGMRAGIPDPDTRGRTITLYIDKHSFRSALSMPDEEHIYVLLTSRKGDILWRSRGTLTTDRAASLTRAVRELSAHIEPDPQSGQFVLA